MKQSVFVLFSMVIMVLAPLRSVAGNLDKMWDRANTAYVNGDYAGALAVYDSIESANKAGVKLYYNMGNAHFKSGHIGKAILYYSKAQRLDPFDEDVEYNLQVAQGYVKDRIEVVPEFFASRWLNDTRNAMSSNAWAVTSLVVLALALCGLLLYLLPLGMTYRKLGFWSVVLFGVLTIVSVTFASKQRSEAVESDDAVVMLSAAPVKSSPDSSSKDIFVIHEGTMVKVLDHLGDWSQISIADGNKGWILTSSIEIID
ncbi:MAG: tetratricopeptide repeat protein [Rikenellaceae bacterium]|nr:tetratricopeptide repeat protein [Rikenellaceae bacterium]